MFPGALRLIPARAPAPVYCRIALDLFQKRIPAKRYAAAHHPQRTPFTNRRPLFPPGMNRHRTHLPQPRCRELAQRFQQIPRDAVARYGGAHTSFYRPTRLNRSTTPERNGSPFLSYLPLSPVKLGSFSGMPMNCPTIGVDEEPPMYSVTRGQ
jgi:hypothetical protein